MDKGHQILLLLHFLNFWIMKIFWLHSSSAEIHHTMIIIKGSQCYDKRHMSQGPYQYQ
jgi:hypothetical protein